MISFKDLLDSCQVQAIVNKLQPTELSVYDSFCRQYSKLFNTSLPIVMKLDPEHVLLQVYESQMDEFEISKSSNLNRLLETLLTIEDPEYEASKDKKLEEDITMYEEEEEERIKEGKPVYKTKNTIEKTELPKQGNVDLSSLVDEEG